MTFRGAATLPQFLEPCHLAVGETPAPQYDPIPARFVSLSLSGLA